MLGLAVKGEGAFILPIMEIDFMVSIYQMPFTSSKIIDPNQSYWWSKVSAYMSNSIFDFQ